MTRSEFTSISLNACLMVCGCRLLSCSDARPSVSLSSAPNPLSSEALSESDGVGDGHNVHKAKGKGKRPDTHRGHGRSRSIDATQSLGNHHSNSRSDTTTAGKSDSKAGSSVRGSCRVFIQSYGLYLTRKRPSDRSMAEPPVFNRHQHRNAPPRMMSGKLTPLSNARQERS